MQEVIMARIERAKFYLTTTDMSIKALSDFCGYESDLHFIRQFKKKEGLTPTEYRQLYKPAVN
jgi:AraC family transcriptional regulator of arabinose operon